MILHRYLWKELFVAFSAMFVLLVFVYVSNRFVGLLADAATGQIPGEVLLLSLALKSLEALEILIPLAFYLSVLVALGRLYRDSEMTAIFACGVGTGELVRILALPTLLLAAVVATGALYLAPWSGEQIHKIKDRARVSSDPSGVSPGRFTELNPGGLVIYVESLSNDGVMHNVFIQGRRGERDETLSAKSAFQRVDPTTRDRFFVLRDGYRYEGRPGRADFRIIEYVEHAVRIDEPRVTPVARKQQARPTASLIGSGDRYDSAELQRRLSAPLSLALLALLAVPLSRTTPRQGRPAKLLGAVLVYIIYSNMVSVAQAWVEQGKVSAAFGLWWAHAALAVLIGTLWVRQLGLRWVWHRLVSRA